MISEGEFFFHLYCSVKIYKDKKRNYKKNKEGKKKQKGKKKNKEFVINGSRNLLSFHPPFYIP